MFSLLEKYWSVILTVIGFLIYLLVAVFEFIYIKLHRKKPLNEKTRPAPKINQAGEVQEAEKQFFPGRSD